MLDHMMNQAHIRDMQREAKKEQARRSWLKRRNR
jgi:uncharacterized protein